MIKIVIVYSDIQYASLDVGPGFTQTTMCFLTIQNVYARQLEQDTPLHQDTSKGFRKHIVK